MKMLVRSWRSLTVGFAATFVGIGLERFAYTPLIPPLVAADWFNSSQAAYLGAANLLGYLFGALSAKRSSDRFGDVTLVLVAFAFSALSFFGCAEPAPFLWFFLWRLISGITGGWLMVLGPSLALNTACSADRAFIGTVIFMGIGAGAFLSAVAMPFLISLDLTITWLVLGGTTVVVTLPAIFSVFSLSSNRTIDKTTGVTFKPISNVVKKAFALVCLAYIGEAIGFVPHTIFWVDFLRRNVGLSPVAASFQWGVFGLGAIIFPLLVSSIVSRIGWRRGLAFGLIIQAAAVGLPYVAVGVFARSLSSLVVGALVPGVVALTSGRIAELVGTAQHKRFWGHATALFAIGQAASGYVLAYLYTVFGSYRPLFLLAAVVLVFAAISAVIDLRPDMRVDRNS